MSNTYLHKLKGKVRRNVLDSSFIIDKFFDRKCGSIDGKLSKLRKRYKYVENQD